jgi:hypothetical protein
MNSGCRQVPSKRAAISEAHAPFAGEAGKCFIPIEAFLPRGGNQLAIDYQRCTASLW